MHRYQPKSWFRPACRRRWFLSTPKTGVTFNFPTGGVTSSGGSGFISISAEGGALRASRCVRGRGFRVERTAPIEIHNVERVCLASPKSVGNGNLGLNKLFI